MPNPLADGTYFAGGAGHAPVKSGVTGVMGVTNLFNLLKLKDKTPVTPARKLFFA